MARINVTITTRFVTLTAGSRVSPVNREPIGGERDKIAHEESEGLERRQMQEAEEGGGRAFSYIRLVIPAGIGTAQDSNSDADLPACPTLQDPGCKSSAPVRCGLMAAAHSMI